MPLLVWWLWLVAGAFVAASEVSHQRLRRALVDNLLDAGTPAVLDDEDDASGSCLHGVSGSPQWHDLLRQYARLHAAATAALRSEPPPELEPHSTAFFCSRGNGGTGDQLKGAVTSLLLSILAPVPRAWYLDCAVAFDVAEVWRPCPAPRDGIDWRLWQDVARRSVLHAGKPTAAHPGTSAAAAPHGSTGATSHAAAGPRLSRYAPPALTTLLQSSFLNCNETGTAAHAAGSIVQGAYPRVLYASNMLLPTMMTRDVFAYHGAPAQWLSHVEGPARRADASVTANAVPELASLAATPFPPLHHVHAQIAQLVAALGVQGAATRAANDGALGGGGVQTRMFASGSMTSLALELLDWVLWPTPALVRRVLTLATGCASVGAGVSPLVASPGSRLLPQSTGPTAAQCTALATAGDASLQRYWRRPLGLSAHSPAGGSGDGTALPPLLVSPGATWTIGIHLRVGRPLADAAERAAHCASVVRAAHAIMMLPMDDESLLEGRLCGLPTAASAAAARPSYEDEALDEPALATPLAAVCAAGIAGRLAATYGARPRGVVWVVATDAPWLLPVVRWLGGALNVSAVIAADDAPRVMHADNSADTGTATRQEFTDVHAQHFLLSSVHALVRSPSGFSLTAGGWGRVPAIFTLDTPSAVCRDTSNAPPASEYGWALRNARMAEAVT